MAYLLMAIPVRQKQQTDRLAVDVGLVQCHHATLLHFSKTFSNLLKSSGRVVGKAFAEHVGGDVQHIVLSHVVDETNPHELAEIGQ